MLVTKELVTTTWYFFPFILDAISDMRIVNVWIEMKVSSKEKTHMKNAYNCL